MSATTVTLKGASACTAAPSPGAPERFGAHARRGLTRGLCSLALTTLVGALAACGGDSTTPPAPSGPAQESLSVQDVQAILAQAIAEAQARSKLATIAVVDRAGNVLAVYRMGTGTAPGSTPDNPPETVTIASLPDAAGNATVQGGLEGITLPIPNLETAHLDDQAAIAKAISGAYLSTGGHAFSTRTASQIIESHFNPGELGQPAGPLFGVQFSSLACSDFINKFNGTAPGAGPHRTPLGLSADPGGLPLYKNGAMVGGIGVIADGFYTLDNEESLTSTDDVDEAIAYAGTFNYAPPDAIRAEHITVNGRLLRYSNFTSYSQLAADPSKAPAFTSLTGVGALIATTGYSTATIQAGTVYDQPASGVRADGGVTFPNQDAFVFVDDANNPRFPPIAGTDGSSALTAAEVTQILSSALAVTSKTRAQIRIPLGDTARVTISVVDTRGVILGMVASRDAPVFGADVSIQKARSSALLSSTDAATFLTAQPAAQYLQTNRTTGATTLSPQPIGDHVTIYQNFLGDPTALTNGIAYSEHAIGNVTRPFFPDGVDGAPRGPLSTVGPGWSPFHTGLQLDLSNNAILQHVLYVATNGGLPDVGPGCSGVNLNANLTATRTTSDVRIGNGLQIFSGGVPIYRGQTLVGAIGVSGDGTQQDDLIAFRGLGDASAALNGAIGNAPASIRADLVTAQGTRLQYVQCPVAPFVNSNEQEACKGL